MSDIVIKAENLGKKYIISHQAELRDFKFRNGNFGFRPLRAGTRLRSLGDKFEIRISKSKIGIVPLSPIRVIRGFGAPDH